MIIETEFVVQHFYTVKPNDQPIDKELTHYTEAKWREELSQRFHSIYRSIMANEKAALAIIEYTTMFHHDIQVCSTDDMFLEAYYGEKGTNIKDTILRIADCLSAEDKTWLEENVGDEELQTILLPCFKPRSDWKINIVEHRHNRKEER